MLFMIVNRIKGEKQEQQKLPLSEIDLILQ